MKAGLFAATVNSLKQANEQNCQKSPTASTQSTEVQDDQGLTLRWSSAACLLWISEDLSFNQSHKHPPLTGSIITTQQHHNLMSNFSFVFLHTSLKRPSRLCVVEGLWTVSILLWWEHHKSAAVRKSCCETWTWPICTSSSPGCRLLTFI